MYCNLLSSFWFVAILIAVLLFIVLMFSHVVETLKSDFCSGATHQLVNMLFVISFFCLCFLLVFVVIFILFILSNRVKSFSTD